MRGQSISLKQEIASAHDNLRHDERQSAQLGQCEATIEVDHRATTRYLMLPFKRPTAIPN